MRYDTRPDSLVNPLTEAASDSASFGVGIDHVIGPLTFGVGYGSRTDKSLVLDGVADHRLISPIQMALAAYTGQPPHASN